MRLLKEAKINPGDKVFVRCDLDVPINNEKIQETFRLDASLETLKYIVNAEALPKIAGHMKEGQSTQILKDYFTRNLGENKFKLTENLRFDPREKENDVEYAKELAADCSIYVNESFATCHREHTSIVAVPKMLPSYAGFRLEKEITELDKLINSAQKPLIAIIGGAKVESKKPTISKFLEIADCVLVGGKIGLEWKEEIPKNLILPEDYARENKDIGARTIAGFCEIIKNARTVFWAGPLGLYQKEEFMRGTREIAKCIANTTSYSVIGGGDTVTAINSLGLLEEFSFASTGGGAMLEYLAKGTLVGLETLK